MKIEGKAIQSIDELQTFLEADLWKAFKLEFKNREDMKDYLQKHFATCRQHIINHIIRNKSEGNK